MSHPLARFLRQPVAAYRDFQLVFTVLTLNFAIPAASYALAPEIAVETVAKVNALLGGAPYDLAEANSTLWRYLGTANVFALAFMCFLLQWDLRRHAAVLLPLAMLKGTAAALWLAGFVARPELPVCLAVAVLDGVTTAAMLYFGGRALRALRAQPAAPLLPAPRGGLWPVGGDPRPEAPAAADTPPATAA